MFYDDKPIENLSEDSLGRASFSRLLAQTLYNLKNSDTFTVGLYGKWVLHPYHRFKSKLNTWFTPSLITAKPCMESVNRQYGINAKRCMESSRKKCTIGDAIRLRQFHTRQSVMPYQAFGLNKNNLNCPFRFNLGYFLVHLRVIAERQLLKTRTRTSMHTAFAVSCHARRFYFP